MQLTTKYFRSRWNLCRAILTIAFCCLSVPTLTADCQSVQRRQIQSTDAAASTSSLIGHVAAQPGAPIAGASVLLRNLANDSAIKATSNPEGLFRFAEIPPGDYRLEIAAPGYRTFVLEHLPLLAGDLAKAQAVLYPGSSTDLIIGETTNVTSRAGTALAGKTVSDLPENQRNFVNVVQVSAGANEGSTNAAANGSRPGAQHESSAVSIGGEPETSNYTQIDG